MSRSLAACEGAVLLVDASQGIQAQTLATSYQALEHDIEVVAALNKIDLPAADPERYADEIERVLGIDASTILRISAKTGCRGRRACSTPSSNASLRRSAIRIAPLRALIFDSIVRPVPRCGELGPRRGRGAAVQVAPVVHAGAGRERDRGDRDQDARADPGCRARPGRGRLPDRRDQRRRRGTVG